LSNNQLTCLPENIGTLYVEFLYLEHNKLTRLPDNINIMMDVIHINLQGNDLPSCELMKLGDISYMS
jgi:hypothetical protein